MSILEKDNLSKFKKNAVFKMRISFIKGNKATQTCLALVQLPPKPNNWLCHAWEQ